MQHLELYIVKYNSYIATLCGNTVDSLVRCANIR